MFSLSIALFLSATSPAADEGSLHRADHGSDAHGAALVVAQEGGGGTKEGTPKPGATDKAKKPGAGILKGKELGFMERFAPFGINDGAAEPVEKNFILVHVLGCLPLGGLWAPLILYPTEGRPELASDQLLSYLIPFAITWGAAMGVWVVALVPSFFFPPCGFLGCLGCPIGLAGWWVSNNASMNAWDRAYKGKPITGLPPERKPDTAVAMAY